MGGSLLYVRASPAAASVSADVALAFIDEYRRRNPEVWVDTLDVWRTTLPEFDEEMIQAKWAVLKAMNASDSQKVAWERASSLSRRFNAADTYVFAVPMWNFSVPYKLKHFIDVVTLPGQNWVWSRETGYRGLLSGKRALVVYASAGAYPVAPIDASDLQKPLLRRWLQFLGVTDIAELVVDRRSADAGAAESVHAEARRQAARLAAEY